jgi:hypothetical protein
VAVTSSHIPGQRPGYFVPLLIVFVLSLLCVAVLVAFGASRASGGLESNSATPARMPNGLLNMPPFEMVRVVTSDGHEGVFHFRWESAGKWTETLVSTNSPVPAFAQHDPAGFLNLDSYEEAADGQLLRFDMVRECLTCPVGRRLKSQASEGETWIPGVWFWDLEALIRTRKHAQVTETETEVTVRVTTPVDIEEWVFDRRTGIPIGYRTMAVDGTVGSESRATSVVLLSGETVR